MRYAKFPQTTAGCLCCNLLFPCLLQAEDGVLDWQAQLYGGEYYEDQRIGLYGIASREIFSDFTVVAEILHERYRGGYSDRRQQLMNIVYCPENTIRKQGE